MTVEQDATLPQNSVVIRSQPASKRVTFPFASDLSVPEILRQQPGGDTAARDGQEDTGDDSTEATWFGTLSRESVADRVVSLLRKTYATVVPPPNAPPLSDFLQAVHSKPDFLLPQRELAPSRAAVAPSFTSEVMATTHGLFSLLVFRLITFNTDALRSTPSTIRKTVFASLHEWDVYLAMLKVHHGDQADNFYCNRNAVGKQTQVERVVENAAAYWEAANGASWPALFTEGPPTFSACFKAITQLRWVDSKTAKKAIPPLLSGALSRYLICTDLVYSGAVKEPTMDELATHIHYLNLL